MKIYHAMSIKEMAADVGIQIDMLWLVEDQSNYDEIHGVVMCF